MEQVKALQVIGECAADQWGMITAAQAEDQGIDRVTLVRLVESGLLNRLTHGVYTVPAAAGVAERHAQEKAAWLRLAPHRMAWQRRPLDDDGGVLSHRSAAQLHGLGDMRADAVEITVPKRRTTRDPHVRLRKGILAENDVTRVDGLPTTTVERTIVDLLADRVDGGHVGDVLAQALREQRADLDLLAPRVAQHAAAYGIRGRDGRELLRMLLTQVGYRAGSDQHHVSVEAAAQALAELDGDQLSAISALATSWKAINTDLAKPVLDIEFAPTEADGALSSPHSRTSGVQPC